MHAAAPSSTADVVLDVARAVCDLAGPPTASFLKQHHVDLANDAERDVHSHSARFQEVAGMYPSDRHSDLLPPVDTPRWTSSGSAMTSLLCGCAWEIVRYFVQQNSIATPPTAVHRYTQPLDQDPWHYILGLAPWGAARPYGVEYLLGVGDGPISSLEYNLVGCVVPVRTTLEADQPLHKCELFCALTLLHRQLKFHGCFDLSVTIIAATDEGQIRVHEASVHPSTSSGGTPTIRITKRLAWKIEGADLQSPDAQA